MSLNDDTQRSALRHHLEWLEQGEALHTEIVSLDLDEMLDRVAALDRDELQKIVLYRIVSERFA